MDAERQEVDRQVDQETEREHVEQEVARRRQERKDKRQYVVQELVQTEKDYIASLSLIYETFLGPNASKHAGVDSGHLCGNVEELLEVSMNLLTLLEKATVGKDFQQQIIGPCFVIVAKDMTTVYAPYCRNHDDVIVLLEKYNKNTEIKAYFDEIIRGLQDGHMVFDIGAMLLKPVQRILKYPLLLNELAKATEDDHSDKLELLAAITVMTDVAQAINEYKRRKDLVFKYRNDSEASLSDKLSKLNIHSIVKKSSRMKEHVSANLGLIEQTRDPVIEREESRLRCLEKGVRVFVDNVKVYMEEVKASVNIQESLMLAVQDYFGDQRDSTQIVMYKKLSNKILITFMPIFTHQVYECVLLPLGKLLHMFTGPFNLFEKRYDKLLDYDNMKRKAESDKGLERAMPAARQDYEALNAQLLDELPTMFRLADSLFRDSVCSFLYAQKQFTDNILKEMVAAGDKLVHVSCTESVMGQFNVRHAAVVDRLALLAFMRNLSLLTEAVPQTDSQRVQVTKQYPAKLFLVTEMYTAVDRTDISVCGGDVVGVIKENDPYNNSKRWLVDNGVMKGFILRELLVPMSRRPLTSSLTKTTEATPQTDSLRACVTHQYPPDQLYQVTETHLAVDNINITVFEGDVVGVIMKKDPNGNRERWVVDNGVMKGFIPHTILTKFDARHLCAEPSGSSQERSVQYVERYADVPTGEEKAADQADNDHKGADS